MVQTSYGLCGATTGSHVLIIVDVFSKWLEIVPVKKATSSVTIDKLRGICSTHGLPDTSDVRYVSKYRNTPGVSGYDTAMLVYRYFYKFKFCVI